MDVLDKHGGQGDAKFPLVRSPSLPHQMHSHRRRREITEVINKKTGETKRFQRYSGQSLISCIRRYSMDPEAQSGRRTIAIFGSSFRLGSTTEEFNRWVPWMFKNTTSDTCTGSFFLFTKTYPGTPDCP